ncbi:hypothetical protein HUU53_03655 [Candidatus Micrarchaeota archaeon]|nr:hypothetical protein [Candidatus Micrarchaeota archaeon]
MKLFLSLVVFSLLLLGCTQSNTQANIQGNVEYNQNQGTVQADSQKTVCPPEPAGGPDLTTVEGRQYLTCQSRKLCDLQKDSAKKQACYTRNDQQKICDVMTDNKERSYCTCDNLSGVSAEEIQNCKELYDKTANIGQ